MKRIFLVEKKILNSLYIKLFSLSVVGTFLLLSFLPFISFSLAHVIHVIIYQPPKLVRSVLTSVRTLISAVRLYSLQANMLIIPYPVVIREHKQQILF